MEIAVEGDSFTPETQNNACVCIIGGADGPTVIMTGEKSQGRLYAACSALHFEPVRDDVEWCTMFSIKNFDETTINLYNRNTMTTFSLSMVVNWDNVIGHCSEIFS